MNTVSLVRAVAATFAMALITGCASQAPAPARLAPPPPASFAKVDRNADGNVDRAEWERQGDAVFRELDTDSDGSVSAEEMNHGFDAFDVNKDGVLSKDEIDVAGLDANGDNVVTREEWNGAVLQSGLDVNHDGIVTRAEIRTIRAEHFKRLDADEDGYASRIELSNSASVSLFRF